MATHDYVIDNSTGANVRADINSVLQAILTNNSSSSAPSTTAAYMWWADTTSGTLKIRNSSDNAWVELLQLDGTLTLEDGSASSPALGFRDDLNTGIFSSAADNFDISTGGSVRVNVSSTGLSVTGAITASGNITTSDKLVHNGDTNTVVRFPANDTIALETAGNESFRVDSSHRILVNTTAQRIISGGSARLHIENNSTELLSICRNSSDNGTALFAIGKTRGGSIVQDDDVLGTISFAGDDGNDLNHSGAEIRAAVDGTPGSNDMPGRLEFRTTADGSSQSSTRMTVDSSGRVLIGKTSTSQTHTLQVQSDSQAQAIAIYGRSSDDIGEIAYWENDGTTKLGELQYRQDHIALRHRVGHIEFATTYSGNSVSERMRLINDQLCIGMTSGSGLGSSRRLQIRGTLHSNNGINILATHNDDNPAVIDIGKSRSSSNAILGNNDDVGQINFYGNDGSGFHSMARILCSCSGNDTSDNDLPSVLKFFTLTDNSTTLQQRMLIDQNGITTLDQANSSQSSECLKLRRVNAATNVQNTMIVFECGNQGRGAIVSSSSDGSSPQFSSGSDYRMKENIRDYTQGYDTIKAIPVKIFDMLTDGAKDIKGWIAHEVQPYIPEAVLGNKDAVVTQAMVDSGEREASELGNDIMQNLAMGAFMPDVVSALQTAIAKIEVLETKVAALEAG